MNRFFSFSPKFLVAATLATAALGAASVAEAHPDVYFSVVFQGGPVWFEPTPTYAQPRPVYVQSAPVYARPPVFFPPREVFEGPRFGGDEDRRDWERERDWPHAERHRHDWHEEFRSGDRGDRERHHDHRD